MCLSGLGYIVGTTVAEAFNNKWQWGLRVRDFSVFMCFQRSLFAFLLTKKNKIPSIIR